MNFGGGVTFHPEMIEFSKLTPLNAMLVQYLVMRYRFYLKDSNMESNDFP